MTAKHLFSVFDVTRQVFYKTPLSLGIVNLKPLIPGRASQTLNYTDETLEDVLILPQRVVPRIKDLQPAEIADLFTAVQTVGRSIEKAFGAHALTIALQDGAAAGQSVPHVHVHILPRYNEDFDGDKDKIYPALEKAEAELDGDLGSIGKRWTVPKDEDRKPRTLEEMEKEARWLQGFCSDFN